SFGEGCRPGGRHIHARPLARAPCRQRRARCHSDRRTAPSWKDADADPSRGPGKGWRDRSGPYARDGAGGAATGAPGAPAERPTGARASPATPGVVASADGGEVVRRARLAEQRPAGPGGTWTNERSASAGAGGKRARLDPTRAARGEGVGCTGTGGARGPTC